MSKTGNFWRNVCYSVVTCKMFVMPYKKVSCNSPWEISLQHKVLNEKEGFLNLSCWNQFPCRTKRNHVLVHVLSGKAVLNSHPNLTMHSCAGSRLFGLLLCLRTCVQVKKCIALHKNTDTKGGWTVIKLNLHWPDEVKSHPSVHVSSILLRNTAIDMTFCSKWSRVVFVSTVFTTVS